MRFGKAKSQKLVRDMRIFADAVVRGNCAKVKFASGAVGERPSHPLPKAPKYPISIYLPTTCTTFALPKFQTPNSRVLGP